MLEHALQLGEVEQVAQGDDVEVDAAGVHPFALALQHVALYVRRRDGRKPSAAEVFDAVVERGTLPGDGEFALGLGGSQPVQIDMAVIIERWRDAGGGCLALLAVLYELALGEHGLWATVSTGALRSSTKGAIEVVFSPGKRRQA